MKHVAIMKIYRINNIAIYSLLCSALGIGVLLLMFSIIPVLAGASPTTSVKVYVWIILFALIVIFVLSLIYCILDFGQYLLGRSDKKNEQQISEDSEEPIKTDSDDYNEQKTAPISDLAPEEKVVSTEPIVEDLPVMPEIMSEQEAIFNKRYVAEEYKDMHIFDVITSMKDHGEGGSFFVRVIRIAKGLKVINMMLPYKDAKMIFGEDFVGKASNYNTQLNKKDGDVDKIYEIKRIFKEKLEIMKKKYPREKSMFDETLED